MSPVETDEEHLRTLSAEVIKKATLEDIRLRNINAELLNAAPALPIAPDVTIDKVRVGRGPRFVVYYLTYIYSTQDREKAPVWRATFTFSLSFFEKDGIELNDDEIRAFGAVGVVEIAHPYARELVHSLTSRMRVPTLFVELFPPRLRW